MKYIFSHQKSDPRFVDIEFIVETNGEAELQLRLPAWRPGRYELGNFAKNIRKFIVFDEDKNPLAFHKTSKDSWNVSCKGKKEIHVHYTYHANQLDAGACWSDDKQLYINPIHCCLFVEERKKEPCMVEIHVPQGFETATSLLKTAPQVSVPGEEDLFAHTFYASHFDELVDSPFVSCAAMKHHSFEFIQTFFHIWFVGECKPDFEKIESDFLKFIYEQYITFGSLAFAEGTKKAEYHFIFQVTPYTSYHGVEHLNSTVIALGPSFDIMSGLYKEFLGISSHEFFHTWNIKCIRPVEMMPYNYTNENYSRLGFVAEGVTTYYGDLMLLRSRTYTEADFFLRFAKQLQKHFDNPGRFNLSVADSSFDTWLDGYVPGVPGRKVSIYTEGCLCALMLDLMIRKETGNKKSLDDVMKLLFENFGKKKTGYSETDYCDAVKIVSGNGFEDYFRKYVFGTENYQPALKEVFRYVGCDLVELPSPDYCERYSGFKHTALSGGMEKITAVAPASPVYFAGLCIDDEIFAVNGFRVESNLSKWCNYFQGENILLSFYRKGELKTAEIKKGNENFFNLFSCQKIQGASRQQQENYLAWTKNAF